MFVAYYSNGRSMAPLTQYKNNEIKQELKKKKTISQVNPMKDYTLI